MKWKAFVHLEGEKKKTECAMQLLWTVSNEQCALWVRPRKLTQFSIAFIRLCIARFGKYTEKKKQHLEIEELLFAANARIAKKRKMLLRTKT